jgi:rhodanese-related sulfurtransferase
MALLIEFLSQQWILALALVVCLVLLMQHESRKGGQLLSSQQLINKVNQEQAVVLDLRDTADFDRGHVVDAVNIPAAKLADRLQELESYRDRPIILVCKMGQHSGAAGKTLGQNGFSDVARLRGGMTEWESSQLPLVRG